MPESDDLKYILSDCFLAVGQAVGTDKTVDFDVVTWWHQRYRRAFHEAIAMGASWSADRHQVTAVGRYLGQRVAEHVGSRTVVDLATASRASVEVERGCNLNGARDDSNREVVRTQA